MSDLPVYVSARHWKRIIAALTLLLSTRTV
jgi:hypothetical protein